MGGVIADPKNIRDFQRQLGQFNRELDAITRKLKGQLTTLNSTWRDSEYQKFEQQINEVMTAFNRYLQQSEEYTRYLDKKAKPLEDYQGRGR